MIEPANATYGAVPTSVSHMDASETSSLARRVFSVLLALYGAHLLSHLGEGSLLDGVDLGVHETGHLVFGPFGELIGFAGGTLMQLVMPALFVGYFLRRGDRYGSSVALWWIGQSCANISIYAADARAQELPLVGGGEHDWAYMLGRFGWLSHDLGVGRAFHTAAVLLMFGGAMWGFVAATSAGVVERPVPQL